MQYVGLAFVGYMVVSTLYSFKNNDGLKKNLLTFTALRGHHFGLGILSVSLVVVTYAALATAFPALQWGWLKAIGSGGSVIIPSSDEPGLLAKLIPPVCVLVIIFFLPQFARWEEEMFREGAEYRNRLSNFLVALGFGLIHLIMGIPVGMALALTCAGLLFTRSYLKAFHRTFESEMGETYEESYSKTFEYPTEGEKIVNGQSDAYAVTKIRVEKFNARLQVEKLARQNGVTEATLVHLAHNLIIFGTTLIGLTVSIF